MSMPLWPHLRNVRRVAKSGLWATFRRVATGPKLAGKGCPARRWRSGLGSNVSRWLGPPCMNR